MIQIVRKDGFGIKFPTSLSEVNVSDLKAACEGYKFPKNYALVALLQTVKIGDLVFVNGSKKDIDVRVNPMLINKNGCCPFAEDGEMIITTRSSIERAIHVHIPVSINNGVVQAFFAEDDDLRKSILTGKPEGAYADANVNFAIIRNMNIIIVEFKVIPENEIYGSIDATAKPSDKFRIVEQLEKENKSE